MDKSHSFVKLFWKHICILHCRSKQTIFKCEFNIMGFLIWSMCIPYVKMEDNWVTIHKGPLAYGFFKNEQMNVLLRASMVGCIEATCAPLIPNLTGSHMCKGNVTEYFNLCHVLMILMSFKALLLPT